MLDPTGHVPGAVPPHDLSALRGETIPDAPCRDTPERVAADAALAIALRKVVDLTELSARYAADTTDNAWQLQAATQEAAQAMLAAYVGFRERVRLA